MLVLFVLGVPRFPLSSKWKEWLCQSSTFSGSIFWKITNSAGLTLLLEAPLKSRMYVQWIYSSGLLCLFHFPIFPSSFFVNSFPACSVPLACGTGLWDMSWAALPLASCRLWWPCLAVVPQLAVLACQPHCWVSFQVLCWKELPDLLCEDCSSKAKYIQCSAGTAHSPHKSCGQQGSPAKHFRGLLILGMYLKVIFSAILQVWWELRGVFLKMSPPHRLTCHAELIHLCSVLLSALKWAIISFSVTS